MAANRILTVTDTLFPVRSSTIASSHRPSGYISADAYEFVDKNPFAVPPSELSELQVLLTLLEGEPVHGDFSF